MKDRKRRYETFSFYDHTGIEAHLERMAEQGWLLEKIGQLTWHYRRIEPKKLTFAVCYYPKASVFDPEPTEEQRTFYDFCQHTGWTLATSSAQLQVFYNERENPIPIDTDPALEVNAIHKSAKKSFLPSNFLLLAVGLMNIGMRVWQLMNDPIAELASTSSLFSSLCFTLLILLCVVDLSTYFLWHRRAVKAAEQGEFLDTRSHPLFQFIVLAVVLAGFVWWTASQSGRVSTVAMAAVSIASMFGMLFLVYGIRELLKRKKTPAGTTRLVTLLVCIALPILGTTLLTSFIISGSMNRWFAGDNEETYEYYGHTWTVHNDELPLTVEDLLGIPAQEGYSRELDADETILLAQYTIEQCPRFDAADRKSMPELHYAVIVAKAPFLYDLCREQLLHEKDYRNDYAPYEDWYSYQPIDPAPWGAAEAYQWTQRYVSSSSSTYLLCYQDRVVYIDFDLGMDTAMKWEVTPEQMALVGERLGGPPAKDKMI